MIKQKPWIRRFSFRIFSLIFITMSLSVTLVTTILFIQTKQNYQTSFNQQSEILKNNISIEFLSIIESAENLLSNWSHDEDFIKEISSMNSNQEKIFTKIYHDLLLENLEASVTILNENKNPILSTEDEMMYLYKYLPDNWGIKRLITNKKKIFHYIPQDTPALPKVSILTLGIPIHNRNEKVIGTILLDINDRFLNSRLNKSSELGDPYIEICDTYNYPVYHSGKLRMDSRQFSNYKKAKNKLNKMNSYGDFLIIESDLNPHYTLYIIYKMDFIDLVSKQLVQSFIIILFIMMILSLLLSLFVSKKIYQPIDYLMKSIDKITNEDFSHYSIENQPLELQLIAQKFNQFLSKIDELIQANKEKQAAIYVAKFKALQAQINPHFIYNVLNSINFMAKLNNVPEISDMVTHLARILRSNIHNDQVTETIFDSLQVVESYLTIQHYRYLDRFSYTIFCDKEAQNIIIPKLLLQPIVENAIEHGIEILDSSGQIYISIVLTEDNLVFLIEDNGPGYNTNFDYMQNELKSTDSIHNKVGLKNIYSRLIYFYKDKFEMIVHKTGGTTVLITIEREVVEKNV